MFFYWLFVETNIVVYFVYSQIFSQIFFKTKQNKIKNCKSKFLQHKISINLLIK